MNQRLRSLFAAELKELRGKGRAGAATQKYLLDQQNNIKIPNVIYCLLQMLGAEYEDGNSDVMYVEYGGSCRLWDRRSICQTYVIRDGEIRWYFWYVKPEDILDITNVPANSLGDSDCNSIADNGENAILFHLYAKLAYQCMIIYDTGCECYLPPAVFKMAKYILLLFSHNAFYAALKSAIKHRDDEGTNEVIREVLATIFGLEDVEASEIYSKISQMQGSEKAAIGRVIAKWDLGGDLQRRLKETADKSARMLSHSRIRELIEGYETEVRHVLGEELFHKMQEHYQKNMAIR